MAKSEREWDQHYLDGHTPWDKGEASPSLQELISKGAIPSGSDVLVPGCGYGHDVSELAQAGCMGTGLDISASAVAGAKLANGGENSQFAVGDFFDPELAKEKQYDLIWEHTCFCAIDPEQRDAYVESAYRLLKPCGSLIGVFFAFSDDLDAGGPPFKTNIKTLYRHFKPRFTLGWERRPERCFPTRKGQEWLMCWHRR